MNTKKNIINTVTVVIIFSLILLQDIPLVQAINISTQDTSGPGTSADSGSELNAPSSLDFNIRTGVDTANPGLGNFNTSLNGGSSGSGAGPQPTTDPTAGGLTPTSPKGVGATSATGQAAQGAITCSIGSVLANTLKSFIYSGLSKLFDLVPGLSFEVPVKDAPPRYKEVGLSLFGFPILPSWDSFAYCLANATIQYVSDSTIAWIRSGFEGKPAFVDNPTRLFEGLANYEAENFLEGLGDGFLCEPFQAQVVMDLVSNYQPNYNRYGKCNIGSGELESFLNGTKFNYDTYFNVTQNPANNPMGAYLLAESEMRNRIQARVGPVKLELDWNKGYFSWKDEMGNNVSPGSAIQSQLEKTLGLPKDRLVLADEFDEVISELVNQLIKVALTETLGAFNGAVGQ